MGDKPRKPITIGTSTAVGGFNVPVRRRSPTVQKQAPLPTKKLGPTVGDLAPAETEDPSIDKVIDDIVMSESNEVLAAEDATYLASLEQKPKKRKGDGRLKKILKSKWTYAALALIIIGLMAWPLTRYKILSLVVKNEYEVSVIDSVTHQPVSDATIKVDDKTLSTNDNGQASTNLPLGKYAFTVTKSYYANYKGSVFIGLSKPKEPLKVAMNATGRQVIISVVNKLSNRPLEGVKVSILNANYETNSKGQTQIILPTNQQYYSASFSATGFNNENIQISVNNGGKPQVAKLVPSGYIYYLNGDTGAVNVIKANLDGSNPTILLSGTAEESSANTALYPSPDWKYLVLETTRNTTQPVLYVINTATGNLTEFDSSQDSYLLIGWSGDDFLYDEIAGATDTSTVGREQIKSYDALTGQLNILDQDQTEGNDPSYAFQSFSDFYLLNNQLAYTTTWNSVASYDISSLNDTIRSVEPNGLNKKDYSQFPASTTGSMSLVRYQPQSLYLSVNNTSTNQISYYSFTNGALSNSNITAQIFGQTYPIYYTSPSNLESLWSTSSNGQYVTYSANQSGQNSKNLNVQTDFSAYGWYDNLYVLLSSAGKLYIAPVSGSAPPTLIGSYLPNGG